MNIEYEAKFSKIDKDEIRAKLKEINARLVRPEFLQKRITFHLPKGHEIPGGWVRIRDEGDKTTMSLKVVRNEWEKEKRKIENQKEIYLKISDFKEAESFLTAIGCRKKAYQESKRELWLLDGIEITIDEWPFLEPYIEIEADSEERVKSVAEKLGFDYSKALFATVAVLYNKKYGVSQDIISNHTPKIVFEGKNPFK